MPMQEICSATIYLVSKNSRNITTLEMSSENGMTCYYKPDHLCENSCAIMMHGAIYFWDALFIYHGVIRSRDL
jgi:hypothetical protein